MLLAPVGLVVFTFSLIIGHFISEPLRLLAKKTAAYRTGTDVPFEPDGRLYEADQLSADFKALVQTTKSQQHDLVLKERRQAAFISDVAHELRTPLTAIRGNAEMLEDPDLPPELHEKFCSIIIAESERLSRLTHDLLTLQRIDDNAMPMELSRVNLRELATGVLDALEPILRDRHANTEIVGEAPDVLGDPDRLKQAVQRLVAERAEAELFADRLEHALAALGVRVRIFVQVLLPLVALQLLHGAAREQLHVGIARGEI